MDQFDDIYKERVALLRSVFLRSVFNKNINKNDDVPAKIEEGLYLGSRRASRSKRGLKGLNVTHVLTVATSLDPLYPNHFTYKVINILDKKDVEISLYFDECFDFIDDARKEGGGVLVHCFAGISRSASVVIAYLMKKRNLTLSAALKHVRTVRPIASPNRGFMLQLRNFEKSLQEEVAPLPGQDNMIEYDVLVPLPAEEAPEIVVIDDDDPDDNMDQDNNLFHEVVAEEIEVPDDAPIQDEDTDDEF